MDGHNSSVRIRSNPKEQISRRVLEPLAVPPNLIPAGCKTIEPQMLTMVELGAEQIERISVTVPGGAENIQDFRKDSCFIT
jgi:hypothetical protein